MMTGVQIIAIFFALFMAYLTFLNYKRKDFSLTQLLIWGILWVLFILMILMPNKFNFILETLGIARAFDLFTIIGFVVILFLTFYNYILINKIKRKLEDTTRKKALDEL